MRRGNTYRDHSTDLLAAVALLHFPGRTDHNMLWWSANLDMRELIEHGTVWDASLNRRELVVGRNLAEDSSVEKEQNSNLKVDDQSSRIGFPHKMLETAVTGEVQSPN